MVTLAQRLTELRDERGLSRPALSAALGFPKVAIEKFETGRQTPTKEQQDQLAAFFGVSLFYLKGESSDRTRQDAWMDADYTPEEEAPRPPVRPVSSKPKVSEPQGGTAVMDSFFLSKQVQEVVRATVLETLKSPEGQELIAKAVRRELMKQK